MPGNEEIWNLITLAETQWRATLGEIYGLDFGTLIQMARALCIEVNQTFLKKLRVYEKEALRIFRDKNKDGKCDKKQKERCNLEFGEFFEWACKNCEKKNEEKIEDAE